MNTILAQWLMREEHYGRNDYAGTAEPASFRFVGSSRSELVLTAPHAVTHRRNGETKLAEIGSGGLAEVLASELGAAALIADGSTTGDANWDDEAHSPFKRQLRALLRPGVIVIDLHGMRDAYQVDVSLGRGHSPSAESLFVIDRLVAAFASAQLSTAVDWPFDARRPNTIVGFVQRLGGSALQIEIARRLRQPVEAPEEALRLIRALTTALASAARCD